MWRREREREDQPRPLRQEQRRLREREGEDDAQGMQLKHGRLCQVKSSNVRTRLTREGENRPREQTKGRPPLKMPHVVCSTLTTLRKAAARGAEFDSGFFGQAPLALLVVCSHRQSVCVCPRHGSNVKAWLTPPSSPLPLSRARCQRDGNESMRAPATNIHRP